EIQNCAVPVMRAGVTRVELDGSLALCQSRQPVPVTGQAGQSYRYVRLDRSLVKLQGLTSGRFRWSKYHFSRHEMIETSEGVAVCHARIRRAITWILLNRFSKKLYALSEAFRGPLEELKSALQVQLIRVGINFGRPEQLSF